MGIWESNITAAVKATLQVVAEHPGLSQDDVVVRVLDILEPPPPASTQPEIRARTVQEFFEHLQTAVQAGFVVLSADDPRRRMIGYSIFDDSKGAEDEGTYLCIGLTTIKEFMPGFQAEGLGVDAKRLREAMLTPGGRANIPKALMKGQKGSDLQILPQE